MSMPRYLVRILDADADTVAFFSQLANGLRDCYQDRNGLFIASAGTDDQQFAEFLCAQVKLNTGNSPFIVVRNDGDLFDMSNAYAPFTLSNLTGNAPPAIIFETEVSLPVD